jgi:hypothetical protein
VSVDDCDQMNEKMIVDDLILLSSTSIIYSNHQASASCIQLIDHISPPKTGEQKAFP